MKTIRSAHRVLIFLLAVGFAAQLPSPARGEERSVDTSRPGAKKLDLPDETGSFTYVIMADRTSSGPISMRILEQFVDEVNVIRPDFVITVGDLIPGYTNREKWVQQMKGFRVVMDRLEVPWFPVAGNHDIYWGGKDKPKEQHEPDYESHFGPLWYSFVHKKCRFIAFYTDEGDPETGKRAYDDAQAQKMSPEQEAWLKKTLGESKSADHVFMFLHIPRWGFASASDWKRTHKILKGAGNVSAVFAGHTHVMQYYGKKDGIEYHTLGSTGGTLEAWAPEQGFLHHYDLVTVRGEDIHIAAVKIGSVIDPRRGRDPRRVAPRKKVPILKKQKWKVDSEETRILSFPFEVPEFPEEEGLLRIALEETLDDSGDRGICYSLLDEHGMSVKNGYLGLKAVSIVDFPVPPKSRWTFLLVDGDTKLDGKKPGNSGTIEVRVNFGAARRGRPRRVKRPNLGRIDREAFKVFLKDRRFRFEQGGKVVNKNLILHFNGIVGHRGLDTTYWEIDGKGRLVFLHADRSPSVVFDKVKWLKTGGLGFEGKHRKGSDATWVLEELE
ncbi:MAG: metallophosphoesterase family protein [Planctomycetota bacterium]|jgi:predicted phosphodiesterase